MEKFQIETNRADAFRCNQETVVGVKIVYSSRFVGVILAMYVEDRDENVFFFKNVLKKNKADKRRTKNSLQDLP